MSEDKNQSITTMQDRKNASIAFFNATNAVIALYASLPAAKKSKISDPMDYVRTMRPHFINDFNDFHRTVISQVGKPSDDKEVADTLVAIEACTSFTELKKLWVDVFTESLRSNEKVAAAKDAKKKSYAAN